MLTYFSLLWWPKHTQECHAHTCLSPLLSPKSPALTANGAVEIQPRLPLHLAALCMWTSLYMYRSCTCTASKACLCVAVEKDGASSGSPHNALHSLVLIVMLILIATLLLIIITMMISWYNFVHTSQKTQLYRRFGNLGLPSSVMALFGTPTVYINVGDNDWYVVWITVK